jgi:hypothetical protein
LLPRSRLLTAACGVELAPRRVGPGNDLFAYAGAVITLARPERVKALVYVTALAPDEGEKVPDMFYYSEPHPQAPKLAPDNDGLIWLLEGALATAFAPHAAGAASAIREFLVSPSELQTAQAR